MSNHWPLIGQMGDIFAGSLSLMAYKPKRMSRSWSIKNLGDILMVSLTLTVSESPNKEYYGIPLYFERINNFLWYS